MSKPRRRHEDLRPEIIALAEHTIRTEGTAGLNARDLAAKAGISVGTLYNIFGHLDGVVRAVNMAGMTALRAELSEALAASEPTVEARLIAMAEAYLAFAKADPNRWESMFHYRLNTPGGEEDLAAKNSLFAMLQGAVGDAEDPEVLLALWAAVHGVAELAVSERMAGMETGNAEGYSRLIVRAGLRGIAVLRAAGEI